MQEALIWDWTNDHCHALKSINRGKGCSVRVNLLSTFEFKFPSVSSKALFGLSHSKFFLILCYEQIFLYSKLSANCGVFNFKILFYFYLPSASWQLFRSHGKCPVMSPSNSNKQIARGYFKYSCNAGKILSLLIKCKEVAKCLSLLDSLPFSKWLVQCLRCVGIQMESNIF